VLELEAGLLALLPLADNPIQRDWYVMHLSSQQLPHVAEAFEEFLCAQGQSLIHKQLERRPLGGAAAAGKRRPRTPPAAPAAAKQKSRTV